MTTYMDELSKKFSHTKLISIGKTHEDRDVNLLQIKKAGKGKPNIFLEHGIHAREWIAPAMALYFMHMLLEVNETNKDYLKNFNFHILPVANPDGYEFTRTADNRMWRKNRAPNPGSKCMGTDLNRNWDFHFGVGSSSDPCDDVYHGSKPFSEKESQHIRKYVEKLDPKPILAHTFHSAGQTWLYPYGYGRNAFPKNIGEIRTLAEKAMAALKAVHGTEFGTKSAGQFGVASGASDDWYKGVLDVRFVYTAELREGHGTPSQFDLPPEEIIPSGEETWAALEVILKELIKLS